jgi:hypothetical protein
LAKPGTKINERRENRFGQAARLYGRPASHPLPKGSWRSRGDNSAPSRSLMDAEGSEVAAVLRF